MRKFINKTVAVTMALSVMLGSSMMMMMEDNASAAKKMKLNKKNLTLKVGKSYKLKLKNAKGKVTWTTNKKKVATVTKKGKVTAKKVGTAKITAKVKKHKFVCNVKILPKVMPTPTATPIPSPNPTIAPTSTPIPYSSNVEFKVEKLENGRITYSIKNNNSIELNNVKMSVMGIDSEGKTINTDTFTMLSLPAGETVKRASGFLLKESQAINKTLSAICIERVDSGITNMPVIVDKTSDGNILFTWIKNNTLSDMTIMYKDAESNTIDVRKNWRDLKDNAIDFFDSIKTFMLPSFVNFDFTDIEIFL